MYVHENLGCSKLEWFIVPDSIALEVSTNYVGLVNIACVYRYLV